VNAKWEAFKAWFKKYFGWIAVAVGFIISFFVGRKSVGGTSADIERLRAHNIELELQLRQLGQEIEYLRTINKLDIQRYHDITRELEDARRNLEETRRLIDEGRTEVSELGENNQRLADWLVKYGGLIKDIQSDK